MKYREYYLRLFGFIVILVCGWAFITPLVYIFIGWIFAVMMAFIVLLCGIHIINPLLDYLNNKRL
jgi:hypothetical protein